MDGVGAETARYGPIDGAAGSRLDLGLTRTGMHPKVAHFCLPSSLINLQLRKRIGEFPPPIV